MAGSTIVCSMCGDVGFADKLFRCARCRTRFQHSYCTNYYGDDAAPAEAGVCDWCLSDAVVEGGKKTQQQRQYSPSPSPTSSSTGCSKQQQQQHHHHHQAAQGSSRSEQQPFRSSTGFGKGSSAGNNVGTSVQEGGRRARRYKLLKDVLC